MKGLNIATSLAWQSVKHPRVGCVIMRKKKVLSVGTNINKSHPLQKRLNPLRFGEDDICTHTQHAEFVAINSVKNKTKLNGCTIYISRLSKKGELLPAQPCNACSYLIKKYNLKVVHT